MDVPPKDMQVLQHILKSPKKRRHHLIILPTQDNKSA